jgi:hypothetical protein
VVASDAFAGRCGRNTARIADWHSSGRISATGESGSLLAVPALYALGLAFDYLPGAPAGSGMTYKAVDWFPNGRDLRRSDLPRGRRGAQSLECTPVSGGPGADRVRDRCVCPMEAQRRRLAPCACRGRRRVLLSVRRLASCPGGDRTPQYTLHDQLGLSRHPDSDVHRVERRRFGGSTTCQPVAGKRTTHGSGQCSC